MFSLFKRLNPAFRQFQSPEEFNKHFAVEARKRNCQEFMSYVMQEYHAFDIFEPNALRAFWERLYRYQEGRTCYQLVCESFDENFQASEPHRIVQQIWAVSHLDTFHYKPTEARTRMPNASTDGLVAPNFGYSMPDSVTYLDWIKTPIARASGDIIVDAFHYAVNLGCNLNEDGFMTRFIQHLECYDENYSRIKNLSDKHLHDDLMIVMQTYLLENVLKQTFVSGKGKTIPGTLLKAAGSKSQLLQLANSAITGFREFANNMLALRPDGLEQLDADRFRGFVLGIGFNGKLFNSPEHSESGENEIWLSFSDSGRKPGGTLLLTFAIYIAKQHNRELAALVESNIIMHRDFARYKQIIKNHLNIRIKNLYEVPDVEWDAGMLSYISKEREKFEGWMSQLEQDIEFPNLASDLQAWIYEVSNWYSLPHDVTVSIAPEMLSEEYHAQELARELLFDALNGRAFSVEHPSYMSMLFLHWKEELLQEAAHYPELANAIQHTNRLDELPIEFLSPVKKLIDELIHRVHPKLIEQWNIDRYGIQQLFENFIAKQKKMTESKYENALTAVKKLARQQQNNPQAAGKIKPQLQKARETLEIGKKLLANLARFPAELSIEDYKAFRNSFFKGRSVYQCVEPSFSKVLGHDRFFSVYISKGAESPITEIVQNISRAFQLGNFISQDVIAPCNKNCRHHALGHLYVGDALGYQSADQLDHMRVTHNCGNVPDRLMTFERYKTMGPKLTQRLAESSQLPKQHTFGKPAI